MSLWYTFTVQQPGELSFILTPNNELDDYDWGLFNITEGGCAGINAQDGSSQEVGCNSYGSFTTNGPTGISTANGGSGSSNGPGDTNGPPFNANLNVEVGQTFALVVMNWSNSPDGYTIDFNESTATLYDDQQPEISAAVPACTNNLIELLFSELIVNSTVESSDFTLSGPGGTFSIASVIPNNPNATYEDQFILNLSETVSQAGTYTLTIEDISGNVEDPCGNTAVAATFELVFNEPITFETEIDYACNSENGAVQVNNIQGGAAPYSLLLNGVLYPNTSITGLTPGVYQLTVNDLENCGVTSSIEIPNHVIGFTDIPEQDSISCSNPMVDISGISILPDQTNIITWQVLGANDSWETLPDNNLAPTLYASGIYRVIALHEPSGCADTASVYISESEAGFIDLSEIRFPNIITPNGDSDNEVWMPFLNKDRSLVLPSVMDTYNLKIFNRWGEMVFDSSGGSGKYWSSEGFADGVYYYELYYRIECGGVQEGSKAGHFELIR